MKHLLFTLYFILLFTIVRGNNYYYVNTEALNCRMGPNKNEVISFKLTFGDSVNVESILNGWAKITNASGAKGYVNIKFLSKIGNKQLHSKKRNRNSDSTWIYFCVLIGLGVIYKILKRFFSTNTGSYQPKIENEHFLLNIQSGNIYLLKGGTTGSRLVYRMGNAVNCALENTQNENSRFLAVTKDGNILICTLNHNGYRTIYDAHRYGKTHQATFRDNDTFIFQTEKGKFIGYINNPRFDKF